MRSSRGYLGVAAAATATFLSAATARLSAQENAGPTINIGGADLGGVVTSAKGPEAGVWVIAETTDLPTKFAKMVVTDDQGRYVLPELPKANYKVWVRGYGLVDSPKVDSEPGNILNLTAVIAPNEAAAAQYYPAIYWFSMLKVPPASDFPGTGQNGNGIPASIKSQSMWLSAIKTDGCVGCHQLGNKATRTIAPEFSNLDSYSAWTRRIQSGQAGTAMANLVGRLDTQRVLSNFADWTDRIAAGELPKSKPERPQGVERNVVVTVWDWGTPKMYLHDEIATDRRNPTVNANGPIYGATEWSTDHVPVLDPVNTPRLRHQDSGARSEDAVLGERSDPWAVALLGQRADLGQPGDAPQSDARREGPRLVHLARARPAELRPSAGRARIIRPRSCSRSQRPAARCRCTIRRPRSSRWSTPASPPIICNSIPRAGYGDRAAAAALATPTSSAGST